MPGWGTGSFENDDAQDFLGKLDSLRIDDLRPILTRAADQSNYLEAAESNIAVAAAEVVAALVDVPRTGVSSPMAPRQIVDWIGKNSPAAPPDLVELAARAVERVRTDSELKDLWLEAEGLNDWSAGLRGLKERLTI